MASRFWVGGTGTWDASDTTHWAASTGGAGGQSVPGSSDTVTFDGSSGGGTVTVNGNITLVATVPSFTMGAFTGTIDFATNNNNISAGGFSLSGAGARTLNMGSGTWTVTGVSGTVWDVSTITSFTLNAGTSTVLFSAVPTGVRGFIPGNTKTYNNWTVTNASANGFLIDITSSGSATFANVTLTNVQAVRISQAATMTISGALTYNGPTGKMAMLFTTGGAATISVANATTLDILTINNMTKAGAGSIAVTNGYDAGGNTGITITGPAGTSTSGVIGG